MLPRTAIVDRSLYHWHHHGHWVSYSPNHDFRKRVAELRRRHYCICAETNLGHSVHLPRNKAPHPRFEKSSIHQFHFWNAPTSTRCDYFLTHNNIQIYGSRRKLLWWHGHRRIILGWRRRRGVLRINWRVPRWNKDVNNNLVLDLLLLHISNQNAHGLEPQRLRVSASREELGIHKSFAPRNGGNSHKQHQRKRCIRSSIMKTYLAIWRRGNEMT